MAAEQQSRKFKTASARVGTTLAGKYRLDELLGVGATGAVYRAHHLVIDRTVALKLLDSSLVTSRESTQRFLREARAASRVRHPNVVEVLDAGEDEKGTPYIALEFLEGQNLAEHLLHNAGTLPWPAVMDVLLPVVDALAAAHVRGVVHRDVKPGNVILSIDDGKLVPKLVDFGLSRIVEPVEAAASPRLTQARTAMGTAPYVAPEQLAEARDVDARADVWSMGVILYHMLAGRPPYQATQLPLLLLEIEDTEPPELDAVAAHVPRELATIVHRCLFRDRSARYKTAKELANALRMMRTDHEAGTTGMALQRLNFDQIMALAGRRKDDD